MKKKGIKLIIGAVMLTMIGSFVGCGSSTSKSDSDKSSKSLSGTVTLSGSSALLPLMEGSVEGFNAKNPNVQISAQAGGSGTGLTQVSDGTVNIGNSDIAAETKLDASKAKELVDHKVVVETFGVVVNKSLGVNSLTSEQVQNIFSGKITNWKEVGGPDKKITLVHRPESSGTRATFVATVLGGKADLENSAVGITQDNNGNVLSAMKSDDGAISYLALSYLTSNEAKGQLEAVKLDGVEATNKNIISKKYKFWSWGHMYTKGNPTEAEKAFMDYIMSKDNKEVVDSLGYISATDMK